VRFSKVGDEISPANVPELAPGIRGIAFDTPEGIYIPLIMAENEGDGTVGHFIDELPKDRRVVFPSVISGRLREMLLRRGFVETEEEDPAFGGMAEILERPMSDTSPDPKPGTDEALDAGCRCPVLDNAHGRGRPGPDGEPEWWVNFDCPLHGASHAKSGSSVTA